MAIDFEATSFGFSRRQEFVKALTDAKKRVMERIRYPGHESVEALHHLDRMLDAVLNDEVFEPHARRMAEGERDTNQPAAKLEP